MSHHAAAACACLIILAIGEAAPAGHEIKVCLNETSVLIASGLLRVTPFCRSCRAGTRSCRRGTSPG